MNIRFKAPVIIVGKLKEDQPKHRRSVFAGLQLGVCAQLVGSTPQGGF